MLPALLQAFRVSDNYSKLKILQNVYGQEQNTL